MRKLALLFLAACSASPAPELPMYRDIMAGDHLSVRWDVPTYVDGNTTGDLACTTTISHPCPFITYTRELLVSDDGTTMSWTDATGGSDANGVPAEQLAPWVDPISVDDAGNLVVSQRGDDAGLRHLATLTRRSPLVDGAGGFDGELVYFLFIQAGTTTFGVHLTFEKAV